MTVLWIVLAAVVFLAVWRPSWALWLTMAVTILYDDRQITESAVLKGMPVLPTIFNIRLAGLQFIDWCVAALLISAIFSLVFARPSRGRAIMKMFRGFSLPVLLSVSMLPYILSAGIGLFNGNSIYRLVQDLQNQCYVAALILVMLVFIDDGPKLVNTLRVIAGTLAVKIVVLLIRYLARVGYVWENVFRFTISSDTVLLTILIGWCLYWLIFQQNTWLRRLAAAGVLAGAAFIEFEIAGRTSMLLILFQLLVIAGYLTPRKRVYFVISLLILAFSVIFYLTLFKPQLASFYRWRIETIFQWQENQAGRGGQLLSNSIKVLEYKNINALLKSKRSLILGMGQGAFWKDDFYPIKMPKINDAYAPGEKEHYSSHLQPLTQLLKMGWAGVILYWGALLAALARLYHLAARSKDGWPGRLVLLGLIPLMFNLSNYVRLFFFIGIFWGAAFLIESQACKGEPKNAR